VVRKRLSHSALSGDDATAVVAKECWIATTAHAFVAHFRPNLVHSTQARSRAARLPTACCLSWTDYVSIPVSTVAGEQGMIACGAEAVSALVCCDHALVGASCLLDLLLDAYLSRTVPILRISARADSGASCVDWSLHLGGRRAWCRCWQRCRSRCWWRIWLWGRRRRRTNNATERGRAVLWHMVAVCVAPKVGAALPLVNARVSCLYWKAGDRVHLGRCGVSSCQLGRRIARRFGVG